MQIDAKMIFDQTDNKPTELKVLLEHAQVQTGTKGIVHHSDGVEQQALCSHQSTTARNLTKNYPELPAKKRSGVTKKTNFSGSAMKGAAALYAMTTCLGCIRYGLMQ